METGEPETIFVSRITTRSGKVLLAANYGLKGFPIKVRPKPPRQPLLPGID